MIVVATDETKGVRKKNKSDSVAVVPVHKMCRKKLKKKPQKSNHVTGSTNAFGNYCCIFFAYIQRKLTRGIIAVVNIL